MIYSPKDIEQRLRILDEAQKEVSPIALLVSNIFLLDSLFILQVLIALYAYEIKPERMLDNGSVSVVSNVI